MADCGQREKQSFPSSIFHPPSYFSLSAIVTNSYRITADVLNRLLPGPRLWQRGDGDAGAFTFLKVSHA